MIKPDQVEFAIEVCATDAAEEDIESAELTKGGPAPVGSKGDPITVGSIALVVLPAVLPKVVDLAQGWSTRGQGRTVKFKGKGIEFEGSPEELQNLLAALEKGRKKK